MTREKTKPIQDGKGGMNPAASISLSRYENPKPTTRTLSRFAQMLDRNHRIHAKAIKALQGKPLGTQIQVEGQIFAVTENGVYRIRN